MSWVCAWQHFDLLLSYTDYHALQTMVKPIEGRNDSRMAELLLKKRATGGVAVDFMCSSNSNPMQQRIACASKHVALTHMQSSECTLLRQTNEQAKLVC